MFWEDLDLFLLIGMFFADQLVWPFKRVFFADQANRKNKKMLIKINNGRVIKIIIKIDIIGSAFLYRSTNYLFKISFSMFLKHIII